MLKDPSPQLEAWLNSNRGACYLPTVTRATSARDQEEKWVSDDICWVLAGARDDTTWFTKEECLKLFGDSKLEQEFFDLYDRRLYTIQSILDTKLDKHPRRKEERVLYEFRWINNKRIRTLEKKPTHLEPKYIGKEVADGYIIESLLYKYTRDRLILLYEKKDLPLVYHPTKKDKYAVYAVVVKNKDRKCIKLCNLLIKHNINDQRFKHNKRYSSEYKIYTHLKNRKKPMVWLSFQDFLQDLPKKPDPIARLYRRNKKLPYSKDNIYWKVPIRLPEIRDSELYTLPLDDLELSL